MNAQAEIALEACLNAHDDLQWEFCGRMYGEEYWYRHDQITAAMDEIFDEAFGDDDDES